MFGALKKVAIFSLFGLLLAGCVTQRAVSLQEARSYRLAGFDVDVRPASIIWGEGELAFLAGRGLDTNNPATADVLNTPEGKAAFEKVVSDRLAARIRPVLATQMTGARPVKVQVTFKRIFVPSTAARVAVGALVGGLAPMMAADIAVIDAATGKQLLLREDVGSTQIAGGGLVGAVVAAAIEASLTDTVFDRLASQIGSNFSSWLLAE
jgi:hypothetical protein